MTIYAASHINRWHWRGSLEGVLPDGFDPSSVAAEALYDFFRAPLRLAFPQPGAGGVESALLRTLERRVRTIVNRLHHRAENRLLRNEPDLAPVFLDDGEPARLIDLIPDPSDSPDTALLKNESLHEFEAFKSAFSLCLADDPKLIQLLEHFCDGRWRPNDLASSLHLPVCRVKNLRRRFLRRWHHFRHKCPFVADDVRRR